MRDECKDEALRMRAILRQQRQMDTRLHGLMDRIFARMRCITIVGLWIKRNKKSGEAERCISMKE